MSIKDLRIGTKLAMASGLSILLVAGMLLNQWRSDKEELANAAKKIGSSIGIISDIAAQTDLLVLNAAIEAVRAGALRS